MIPLNNFYQSRSTAVNNCLLALRTIILSADEQITETVKYGMPCFCFSKRHFCYLWADEKTGEPYILFVEGRRLYHPKLEAGSRTRMKIFRADSRKDLPIRTIRLLLRQALDLYR
ncbi:MAG: DUF1801 domain-containing protein [Cyclobacteriaceae bacterium]|nr:DUF1801 domain-containing protein [Cyclobacteriaceae bacterium]